MPRWVKVFAVVAAALLVMIVVMLSTGHGPGRHLHGGMGAHAGPAAARLDARVSGASR